jgi:hypothetical protein
VNFGVRPDELRTDRTRDASLGFDHHRLLHHRFHDRCKRSADHIRSATRRERIDHHDRVGWMGCFLREGCLEGNRCGSGAEEEAASIYAVLPG